MSVATAVLAREVSVPDELVVMAFSGAEVRTWGDVGDWVIHFRIVRLVWPDVA